MKRNRRMHSRAFKPRLSMEALMEGAVEVFDEVQKQKPVASPAHPVLDYFELRLRYGVC